MGCGRYAYWIGNFLSDYFLFSITVVLNCTFPFMLDLDFMISSIDYNLAFLFLTLGFGLGIIVFAYVFGFLYENSNTAYKLYPFVFVPVTLVLPFGFIEMVAHLAEYK